MIRQIGASEIIAYVTKRICEQWGRPITRPGGQKIARPPDLRIGIGVGVDVQESSLFLISLRDGFETRMIMVPAVICDSHETRGDRFHPPLVGVPIAADQASAIKLIARIGRCDYKAGGMEPGLGSDPEFREIGRAS